MNLIEAWRNWQPTSSPPFLFNEDGDVLAEEQKVVVMKSWEEAYKAKDFAKPGDKRLHLGLLPHPFCGDVRIASVFVLMLNPGLGSTDYFAEFANQEFRDAKERFHPTSAGRAASSAMSAFMRAWSEHPTDGCA